MKSVTTIDELEALFLIPGVGETLRINGRAEIVVDDDLAATFEMQGKRPKSVVVVSVERVYFQCQKALVRSRLWKTDAQIARTELPSTGTMLEVLDETIDASTYDQNYPERLRKSIY